MKKSRLKNRELRIWHQSYLANKYLWINIEWAVSEAIKEISNNTPFVLDVGCGHKPYRDLFSNCNYKGLDCTTVDSSPDIVGDATNIPLETGTVDIVFTTQVIEHVPDPKAMICECYRVLKAGGFLVLTGPFYWPLHEEPFDFHRFTKYGFENLLKEVGFADWQIKCDGGSWAQTFLTINLQLRSRWLAPFWVFFNLVGGLMDKVDYTELSPSNYTILAKK
ncbi:MAG: class I SAM-dependent methyltransferase [Gloeotrichia echinulata DVL01]|jgi:SAM-dependent methyltransferase